MVSKKLRDYVAHEGDDFFKTYWRSVKNQCITLIVDDEEKFLGVIGAKDWNAAMKSQCDETLSIGGIVNKDCITIKPDNMYEQARNIYAERDIEHIPVIDDERNLIDIFTRRRAFYRDYFKNFKLDRMHYGRMIMAAASQAKALGYRAISVIEFGVAGGGGLLAMQFHAREISRIFGIEIYVYGFDTGKGLPAKEINYLDLPFQWKQGLFEMDFTKLNDKLEGTRLIIGDICETLPDFFECYTPAPIGVISVDVDLYSSTLPIMEMIENAGADNFIPRTYIYFDDIMGGCECIGQNKAIMDFNRKMRSHGICISPEGTESTVTYLNGVVNRNRECDVNVKICHFFNHKDYNTFIRADKGLLPLSNAARCL